MVAIVSARLVENIDVHDQLGEGVLWRATDETLWWTDIPGLRLHRLDWATQRLRTFQTPERLGSFGFVEDDDDRIVGAFETGFAFFYPTSGELRWLARPAQLCAGRRLNDGRVGPDGCFWAGSMIEADALRAETAETGLYRLDGRGQARFVRGGFTITNGICWSPDGAVMFMTDTPSRTILRCAFDSGHAGPAAAEPYADFDDGFPDGAVTDLHGNLWSALWGAARVACLDTQGRLAAVLRVPALQPTCPAFCGPGLSLLAVTTASVGMTNAERSTYPGSGSLLIYEGDFAGHSNSYYRQS